MFSRLSLIALFLCLPYTQALAQEGRSLVDALITRYQTREMRPDSPLGQWNVLWWPESNRMAVAELKAKHDMAVVTNTTPGEQVVGNVWGGAVIMNIPQRQLTIFFQSAINPDEVFPPALIKPFLERFVQFHGLDSTFNVNVYQADKTSDAPLSREQVAPVFAQYSRYGTEIPPSLQLALLQGVRDLDQLQAKIWRYIIRVHLFEGALQAGLERAVAIQLTHLHAKPLKSLMQLPDLEAALAQIDQADSTDWLIMAADSIYSIDLAPVLARSIVLIAKEFPVTWPLVQALAQVLGRSSNGTIPMHHLSEEMTLQDWLKITMEKIGLEGAAQLFGLDRAKTLQLWLQVSHTPLPKTKHLLKRLITNDNKQLAALATLPAHATTAELADFALAHDLDPAAFTHFFNSIPRTQGIGVVQLQLINLAKRYARTLQALSLVGDSQATAQQFHETLSELVKQWPNQLQDFFVTALANALDPHRRSSTVQILVESLHTGQIAGLPMPLADSKLPGTVRDGLMIPFLNPAQLQSTLADITTSVRSLALPTSVR